MNHYNFDFTEEEKEITEQIFKIPKKLDTQEVLEMCKSFWIALQITDEESFKTERLSIHTMYEMILEYIENSKRI
jgi:hypothetical protein